jgi:hypothetical protein
MVTANKYQKLHIQLVHQSKCVHAWGGGGGGFTNHNNISIKYREGLDHVHVKKTAILRFTCRKFTISRKLKNMFFICVKDLPEITVTARLACISQACPILGTACHAGYS